MAKRAALIGTGMVSDTFADALRHSTTVTLAGVMARSEASARAFLNRNPSDVRIYASAEEIATDPAVDFVILATPPDARGAFVEAFSGAGKPILMEKPVERTLAAARALADTAKVPIGVVLQHRARPSARALAERASGLGALRAVEVTVPWWRPQSYYDVPGRGTYARDGGGVLLTQAIHTLDLALQFTGPVAEVRSLTATTGFHQMEAEDFTSAALTFANGAIGHVFATTAAFPGRTEEIRLHYADASVLLQSALLEINWHSGETEVIGAAAASGAGADPMAFTSVWHRAVIEDFADSLDTDRPPIAPIRSALAVHALIDAIEQSSCDGAPATPEST
ncbi:MAG: Gfo/Idh/MocA family oxidoreductase [Pseudomonadota bacterium]